MRYLGALLLLILLLPARLGAQPETLFFEDFTTLNNWRLQGFPNIAQGSTYHVATIDDRSVLAASSNAGASALIHLTSFQIKDYPLLRWRWRVDNVLKNGDYRSKAGDDFPLRIYVMFAYQPEKASLTMRLSYELAKLAYGEYPPHSTISYVWSNKDDELTAIASPYTEQAMIVPLQAGTDKLRLWLEEEVDVLADYRRLFGTEPPETAALAVMCDTDNTQESASAFLDFIEVSAKRP